MSTFNAPIGSRGGLLPEAPRPHLWTIVEERADITSSVSPDAVAMRHGGSLGAATPARGIRQSLSSAFLPFAVAAALGGAAPVRCLSHISQVGAETVQLDIAWYIDQEVLNPVPSLITNAQIESLNALLALTSTTDYDASHLASE